MHSKGPIHLSHKGVTGPILSADDLNNICNIFQSVDIFEKSNKKNEKLICASK